MSEKRRLIGVYQVRCPHCWILNTLSHYHVFCFGCGFKFEFNDSCYSLGGK